MRRIASSAARTIESTVLSCNRVAELILQSGGGELVGAPVDVIARPLDLAPIALHVSEVRRILGEKLEAAEILRILRRLGFELIPEPGEEPRVHGADSELAAGCRT